MEEVRQLSLKKQEVWIWRKKNAVDNPEAQAKNHCLKRLTKRAFKKHRMHGGRTQ